MRAAITDFSDKPALASLLYDSDELLRASPSQEIIESLWYEAANLSIIHRNRKPDRTSLLTPFEIVFDKRPTIEHVYPFGLHVIAVDPPQTRESTLSPTSSVNIMIRWDNTRRSYKLFDPVSRKFIFRTTIKPVAIAPTVPTQPTPITESNELIDQDIEQVGLILDRIAQHADDADHPDTESIINLLQHNIHHLATWKREINNDCFLFNEEELQDEAIFNQRVRERHEMFLVAEKAALEEEKYRTPRTFQEAWWHRWFQREWREAIRKEWRSLISKGVFRFTQLPNGRKPIRCRWIFRIKMKDGQIQKFKARLVAGGYSQIFGIDFQETYSPVLKYASLRVLIALATQLNKKLYTIDVKTAYLNADLDEEIYMKIPEFPELEPDCKGKVILLLKGLYGLKQSGRNWNLDIHNFLMTLGFNRTHADPCIYSLKDKDGNLQVILGLYVDDVVLLPFTEEMKDWFVSEMTTKYDCTDIEEMDWILGIKVEQLMDCIRLSQTAYIQDILKTFGMEDCHGIKTPADPNNRLIKETAPDKTFMDRIPYRDAVGKLLFLALCTRPDISFAVNQVAKHCESFGNAHWTAVKRIIRYIKDTSELGLIYKRTERDDPSKIRITAYSDASYAEDKDTRRSTSGVLAFVESCPVIWLSRVQKSVSLSTAEAEYVALALTAQEIVWLRQLLQDIGFPQPEPSVVYEDNQGTIHLSNNPVTSNRSKHIDVRYHFVREQILNKTISLTYKETANMWADALTKGQPEALLVEMRKHYMGYC